MSSSLLRDGRLILAALDYRIRSSVLIGSVFLGFLFNQLLPTAVGGDIVRAYRVRQLGIPMDVAIHSVVLDRLAGIFIAIVGLLALLPFANPKLTNGGVTLIACVVIAAVLGAGVMLWALGRSQPSRFRVIGAFQTAVQEFNASIRSSTRDPLILSKILLFSLVGQLLPIISIGLLVIAFNVHLSAIDISIVTLCAMLAAAIPISFAGWGVREGALVFLLGTLGVAAHTAFSISILFGACLAIAAAPGALLLLVPRPRDGLRHISNP